MMTERVYPRDYDSPPVSGEHAMNNRATPHHHRLLSQDSLMSKDSYAYNSGPPSGTFVIQVQKDQIYRVPPPENAYKFKRYTKAKKNTSCCRRCFCTTLLLIIILAVLFTAASGVFYLIFHPKTPGFDVVGVSIRGINMTTNSGGKIKPVFDFTVKSSNGNGHMGIYYLGTSSLVEVFHDGDKLGSGKMPEYYSPPGDLRLIEVVTSGGEIVLSDNEKKMILAEQKNGRVPLDIQVTVPVKMSIGKVKFTLWKLTAKVKSTVIVTALTDKAKVVDHQTSFQLKPW